MRFLRRALSSCAGYGARVLRAVAIASAALWERVGVIPASRRRRHAVLPAEFLARHDAPTDILSRTRFSRVLDEAMGLGCPIAVHVIRIDRLSDANGRLGAGPGDEISRQVARRLQLLCNKQDLLARPDGREFVLAEIVQGKGQITRTARRLVAALGESHGSERSEPEFSVCVGSALAPVHGEDAEALLRNAGIALAHARSDGPGTRRLFRIELGEELRNRRAVEVVLRNALADDGFELVFQPFHRAADRRLAGFEAQLRLSNSDGGHVSPTLFVPVAERLGLASEIFDRMLRQACEVAATWPSQLTITVTLSPSQFEDARLAERVRRAIDMSGLAARRLELEITEGLLLAESATAMRQLADLKKLGVRIAMTRFGVGDSSLRPLWRFPFDELRIDASLVRALTRGGRDIASAIHSIVALGRALRMTIAAEGVETELQAEFLRQIGCDRLQGSYLGRPMPLEEVAVAILKDFRSALPQEAAAAEPPRAVGEA